MILTGNSINRIQEQKIYLMAIESEENNLDGFGNEKRM